jgi:hypothetical protein
MSKVALRDDLIATRLHTHWDQWDGGTGTKTVYHLTKTPINLKVYISGLLKRPNVPGTAHDYSLSGSTVTFTVAPANGVDILFAQVSS